MNHRGLQRRWGMAVVPLLLTTMISSAAEDPVRGAGATFPAPVYSAWAAEYRRVSGSEVQYEVVGSGAGIARARERTADFGATDYPLPAEDLEREGLMQFPTIVGGVVPVVNISGIEPESFKLSGRILADIYLGKITRWDDPAIVKLNPALKMPRQNITVVHRSDVSGTTYLWSVYLSAAHPGWRLKYGSQPALQWPTGVGGVGNEGVASTVQRTRASLGYVEYAYAKRHHLSCVAVDDSQGEFLLPSRRSFELGLQSARWNKSDGRLDFPGTTHGGQWPITGASYILISARSGSTNRLHAVLEFFNWAWAHGARLAESLDYASLPAEMIADVQDSWTDGLLDSSGEAIWRRQPAP